jgi:pyridoxine 5-phosphate synthase
VHPRPDERHIKWADATALQKIVTTEYNIEGFPDERYLKLIAETKPTQATLVPDKPSAITSNAGWDTISHQQFLADVVMEIKKLGVRVSIFVDADTKMVESAKKTGADRIELYTEPYASQYHQNRELAVRNYVQAAAVAQQLGLGINAGHDLDLHNLKYLQQSLPRLDEVSIGHALICDALYFGLENTIQMYLRELI